MVKLVIKRLPRLMPNDEKEFFRLLQVSDFYFNEEYGPLRNSYILEINCPFQEKSIVSALHQFFFCNKPLTVERVLDRKLQNFTRLQTVEKASTLCSVTTSPIKEILSDESDEINQSEEKIFNPPKVTLNLPSSEKISKKLLIVKKMSKINPCKEKSLENEDYFAEPPPPKTIRLNISSNQPTTHSSDTIEELDGFGLINYKSETFSNDNNGENEEKTSKEKSKCQIEHLKLTDFENYRGDLQLKSETCRLYVKNLPKSCNQDKLHAIFAPFTNDCQSLAFQIQYFSKGKLRNQAFISYPLPEEAALAQHCTNIEIDGKTISVNFSLHKNSCSSNQ